MLRLIAWILGGLASFAIGWLIAAIVLEVLDGVDDDHKSAFPTPS